MNFTESNEIILNGLNQFSPIKCTHCQSVIDFIMSNFRHLFFIFFIALLVDIWSQSLINCSYSKYYSDQWNCHFIHLIADRFVQIFMLLRVKLSQILIYINIHVQLLTQCTELIRSPPKKMPTLHFTNLYTYAYEFQNKNTSHCIKSRKEKKTVDFDETFDVSQFDETYLLPSPKPTKLQINSICVEHFRIRSKQKKNHQHSSC